MHSPLTSIDLFENTLAQDKKFKENSMPIYARDIFAT
jgi:hypothetical protein